MLNWAYIAIVFEIVLLLCLLICLPGFFARRNFLFTEIKDWSVVIIERDGKFDSAILKWAGFIYNDPRRESYDSHYPEWEVRGVNGNPPGTLYSPYDNHLLQFFEGLGYYWIGIPPRTVFARIYESKEVVRNAVTLYREAKETQGRLEKERLDKERQNYERRYAEGLAKARDPDEIRRIEIEQRRQAIEQEFEATKPAQPTPKSKRLTEAQRVQRETSWGGDAFFAIAMLALFGPLLLGALGQGTSISPGFVIFVGIALLIGIPISARAYHFSDGHQRYLRAMSQDEDKKWAEEDAAWRQYELNLTAWGREKRQRLLALDALQTDSDGVTNIGRKIIDELNL